MLFDLKATIPKSKYPFLNESLVVDNYMTTRPTATFDKLDYWIERTPEAIAIINAIVTDIKADGFRFEGAKVNVDKALQFIKTNFFAEEYFNFLWDWVKYGDAYMWVGGVEASLKIQEKITNFGLDIDEDFPRMIRTIPANTVDILHDGKKITGFKQNVMINSQDPITYTVKEVVHGKLLPNKGKVYGYCMPWDAVIETSTGKELIGEIVSQKKDVLVKTYNEDKKIFEFKKIKNYYSRAYPEQLHKISIAEGLQRYCIRCTKEHPILTDNGFVKTEDITLKTKVMVRGVGLSKRQEEFILGSLLGDSNLSNKRKRGYPYYQCTHSEKQYYYLDWIENSLANLGLRRTEGTHPSPHYPDRIFKHSTIASKLQPCLDHIRRITYPDYKKKVTSEWIDRLSPLSIAAWMMDDGSVTKDKRGLKGFVLCTDSFSNEECKLLTDYFKKHDITCKILSPPSTKLNRLWFNRSETLKLFELVKQYFIIDDSLSKRWIAKELNLSFEEKAIPIPVTKIELTNKKGMQVFDIEVEDNHNFISNKMILHNSPSQASLTEMNVIGYLKDYAATFFKNGGVPDWMFVLPNEMAGSPNHRKLIEMLQKYKHPTTKHGNLVFAGEVEAEKLGTGLEDIDINKLAIYFTSVIALAHNMPISRVAAVIGAEVKGSGSGDDLANEGYWSKISEHQDRLETWFNTQLWEPVFKVKMITNKAWKANEIKEQQRNQFAIGNVSALNMELARYDKQLSLDWVKRQIYLKDDDLEKVNPEFKQMALAQGAPGGKQPDNLEVSRGGATESYRNQKQKSQEKFASKSFEMKFGEFNGKLTHLCTRELFFQKFQKWVKGSKTRDCYYFVQDGRFIAIFSTPDENFKLDVGLTELSPVEMSEIRSIGKLTKGVE